MNRGARWTLAIAATGTALCLSVLAGWQRGGSLPERLVWVAIRVVLVACAHLLPALVRGAPIGLRGVAAVLWLACMAAACLGHATFFVLTQRHAGESRMFAVPVPDLAAAGRSLTAVMAERADVTARLATVTAQRCSGNCTTLEARRATLAAKLDALDVEASEIRRRQSAHDRAEERRDVLVADPVTARLAALLGTTATRVDLLSGLAFAAVLEGIACLLWTLTLRPRPPVPDAPPVMAPATESPTPVTESHGPAPERDKPDAGSHAPVGKPVAPLPAEESPNPDAMRLAQAVAAGQVRLTVADIRRHLGCSQARAVALRRQFAMLDLT